MYVCVSAFVNEYTVVLTLTSNITMKYDWKASDFRNLYTEYVNGYRYSNEILTHDGKSFP